MSDRPIKVKDAPGLVWRKRKDTWVATWQARTDLVQRGYPLKTAALWHGVEPDAAAWALIADRCRSMQSSMLAWGSGGTPIVVGYDGTLASLIRCYETDEDSPFRKKRYRTRRFYRGLCRRIEIEHGNEQVADIKARVVLRWHEGWSDGGTKVAMGHAVLGMLRTLCGFGATILEDEECARLSGVLSNMRFSMPKSRTERMTAEQAIAIRAKAHEMGFPSIALAQAMQFELMLRQKDVIGEWVPGSEPGMSDVTREGQKWLRGLRWSEVDGAMILRHTTSKRQKDIEVSLRNAPMVMEELADERKTSGPIIVCERTGVPWLDEEFRRQWRKIATAAGIPTTVRNMDSRAGAISEATDAGAELEHVRHAATHSDIGMTQRYSRGGTEKIVNVQLARAAYRGKKAAGK